MASLHPLKNSLIHVPHHPARYVFQSDALVDEHRIISVVKDSETQALLRMSRSHCQNLLEGEQEFRCIGCLSVSEKRARLVIFSEQTS